MISSARFPKHALELEAMLHVRWDNNKNQVLDIRLLSINISKRGDIEGTFATSSLLSSHIVTYRRIPICPAQTTVTYRQSFLVNAPLLPSQGGDHRFESGTGYQTFAGQTIDWLACFLLRRIRGGYLHSRPSF